jgi:hypothetical protein
MLIHLNRDRPAQSWPGSTRQRSAPEFDSLIVVCGLSLVGLATSLFVLGSPRMAAAMSTGFAIAVLEAGIIAAAVCAVVAAVGRSDR